VGRDKAGEAVSVLHATVLEGHGADVVPVIEGGGAELLQVQHTGDVAGDGFVGSFEVVLGIGATQLGGGLEAESRRDVAVQGIVGAGLVGKQIGDDATARQLGNDV